MLETIITLDGVSKSYRSYAHDFDRVLEIFTGKARHQSFNALEALTLNVTKGEVVGVIGKNGAGKSTLLKLLAGTLQSSTGTLSIHGRVSAILELGASFHPEMSGHDNVYLTCAIQGLTRREADAAYDAIVAFAGIQDFMQRPVKTYSSGMLMRLAFSIATHVNPDILIIDEALSVGDGVFARRSFDRIMEFRKAGKTIFFCSHALYQVEALCDRVLWLEQGRLKLEGAPARVITAYSEFLQQESSISVAPESTGVSALGPPSATVNDGIPRVLGVEVRVDGRLAKVHTIQSCQNLVEVDIRFRASGNLPMPSVGVIILGGDGRFIASAGTLNDGVALHTAANQTGSVTLKFPGFPLLKGCYSFEVYLLCERGLHVYERVRQVAELNVEQSSLELGIVNLPHQWSPH